MADLSDLQPPQDDGPPPIEWAEYEARVTQALSDALSHNPSEREMQAFLEAHPPLIPGAFPGWVGHGGWPGAVISQPPFEGFGHRVPDFMWISRHSGAVEPVLVEIEDPGKPWLVDEKNPLQSHELTQALNQFRQWDDWLHHNQEVFFKTFAIPPEWRARGFHPRFLLIYGRRNESPAEITKLREFIHRTAGVTTLTYDHLAPLHRHSGYITVKSDGSGRYVAHAITPTARLTPDHPDWWTIISGRADAVARTDWLSPERKEYLLDYLPRCDEWASGYAEAHREVFGWRPGEHAGDRA